LNDRDVFSPELVTGDQTYTAVHRQAVKMILLDTDGKIALVGTKGRLLPGGGIEPGEDVYTAAKREALEEVGVSIEVIQEIGFTRDFRERRGWQDTHFLECRVVGEKGTPTTMQADEQGMQVDWTDIDSVVSLLLKQIDTVPLAAYNTHFNIRTQLAALKRYRDIKNT
jgi:ADP-ribose pyrophosphatase YjhB (NUDIX family)